MVKGQTSTLPLAKMMKNPEENYTSEHLVKPEEFVPLSSKTHCHVCEKKFFWLFRPKENCRRCGEVCCQWSCLASFDAEIGVLTCDVYICKTCVQIDSQPQQDGIAIVDPK